MKNSMSQSDDRNDSPAVDEAAKGGKASKASIFAFVFIILLVTGGWYGFTEYRKKNAKKPEKQVQRTDVKKDFSLPKPDFGIKEDKPVEKEVVDSPFKDEEPVKRMSKSRSPIMVTNNQNGQNSSEPSKSSDQNQSTSKRRQDPNNVDEPNKGALGDKLTATVTTKNVANTLHDRNFIISKGTFIECSLQMKLDTSVAGMIACVLTRDVYSDNGKVVILERGTYVTGEYGTAEMKPGMNRIFVLWTRIKTPLGVVVDIDSPATDNLGTAGLGGRVDQHFWTRFGGAIMVSAISDLTSALADRLSNLNQSTTGTSSSNNINLDMSGTSEAASGVISKIIDSTVNIPPTIYKNQGEKVGIYIARDLDFSSVYELDVE